MRGRRTDGRFGRFAIFHVNKKPADTDVRRTGGFSPSVFSLRSVREQPLRCQGVALGDLALLASLSELGAELCGAPRSICEYAAPDGFDPLTRTGTELAPMVPQPYEVVVRFRCSGHAHGMSPAKKEMKI